MTRTSSTDGAERVEITCADGVRLLGHFVRSRSDAPAGLPVLLSPATGVKQHYYLRFVHWLAEQGHDVLVFDYRGSACPCTAHSNTAAPRWRSGASRTRSPRWSGCCSAPAASRPCCSATVPVVR